MDNSARTCFHGVGNAHFREVVHVLQPAPARSVPEEDYTPAIPVEQARGLTQSGSGETSQADVATTAPGVVSNN